MGLPALGFKPCLRLNPNGKLHKLYTLRRIQVGTDLSCGGVKGPLHFKKKRIPIQ